MIGGLGRPHNRHILTQLRTARDLGVPVSTIRHGHPSNDWSRISDREAAVALTEYEDSLHSCGHPAGRAFDDDADGEYEVRHLVCQACAAMDRLRQEQTNAEPLPPGTVAYVVDLRDFPDA